MGLIDITFKSLKMETTVKTNPYKWYYDKEKPSEGIKAEVDLHYAYKFHNGFTFDIKKGDIVYLIAPDGFNTKECCWWGYGLVLDRNGELIYPHHSISFRQLTYPSFMYKSVEYTMDYCNEVIQNFILQLEGKIPCVDLVYENQVFPNVNPGETLIIGGWENGITFVNVSESKDGNVIGEEYKVFFKGDGLPWGNAKTVTYDNYWLCKYGYVFRKKYNPYEPVKAEPIYLDLIYSEFQSDLFKESFYKLKV